MVEHATNLIVLLQHAAILLLHAKFIFAKYENVLGTMTYTYTRFLFIIAMLNVM